MDYVPRKGGAILAPFNGELHFFGIMNDPGRDQLCLMLMVTTIRQGRKHDPACVLDVGDHDFINRPSYVLYRMADTMPAGLITAHVKRGVNFPKTDLSEGLFERMAEGIFCSDEVRPRIIKFARTAGI